MQEKFLKYNKLIKPRIIRESTNRLNIRYIITRKKGANTFIEKAAHLV